MQTFLPFPDFIRSAQVLDRARLGKQRVENLQIMKALLGLSAGWVNHPATRMWVGHEGGLLAYQEAVCAEWVSRGYTDTCLEKTRELLTPEQIADTDMPDWFGNPELHQSHQSNLLRKDPVHYGHFFPEVPNDLPYVWPK